MQTFGVLTTAIKQRKIVTEELFGSSLILQTFLILEICSFDMNTPLPSLSQNQNIRTEGQGQTKGPPS